MYAGITRGRLRASIKDPVRFVLQNLNVHATEDSFYSLGCRNFAALRHLNPTLSATNILELLSILV